MTMLKAIETEYKGCRFRSRLEARWAVFFDSLPGVKWDYEPEGFELEGGLRYLPDFKVNYLGWVEIKPDLELITDEEWKKMNAFAQQACPKNNFWILDGAPDYKFYHRYKLLNGEKFIHHFQTKEFDAEFGYSQGERFYRFAEFLPQEHEFDGWGIRKYGKAVLASKAFRFYRTAEANNA